MPKQRRDCPHCGKSCSVTNAGELNGHKCTDGTRKAPPQRQHKQFHVRVAQPTPLHALTRDDMERLYNKGISTIEDDSRRHAYAAFVANKQAENQAELAEMEQNRRFNEETLRSLAQKAESKKLEEEAAVKQRAEELRKLEYERSRLYAPYRFALQMHKEMHNKLSDVTQVCFVDSAGNFDTLPCQNPYNKVVQPIVKEPWPTMYEWKRINTTKRIYLEEENDWELQDVYEWKRVRIL